MNKLRSLIVEDEPHSRARLRRMLGAHPEIEVVGEAVDGIDALEKIRDAVPDLLFLDIEMPGLTGFQLLRAIPSDLALPYVIFITGYDQYALEAFDANALAYLLKPLEADRLAQAVDRAVRLHNSNSQAEQRQTLEQAMGAQAAPLKQIVGRKRDRFVPLAPADVLFFHVQDGLVRARTALDSYLVNHTIADLEASLDASSFFRARRDCIVNLANVREIKPYFRSSFLLVMRDEAKTEITVSERQAKLLRKRMPGL
jgi:two-component system, LytTR family, response regulator